MKQHTIKKCAFWVLLSIAVGLIITLVCITQASAGQVTLAWDPNNPTPDGYRVYQRVKGGTYDYTKPVWPTDGKNHTETTCTINGLTEGQTYYFVVRAYVGADESGDSNEVAYTVPKSGQAPEGGTTTVPPTNLEAEKPPTQLDRIEAAVAEIWAILTGDQQPGPALVTPYCGNPESKIYHKSSHWCGSNAVQFNTTKEAIAAGYTPCGVCKP